MSKGYLMFAYNNSELDYGTMAICSALLIKKNLSINAVALVTSLDTLMWMQQKHSPEIIDRAFDHIIVNDLDRQSAQMRGFFDTKWTKKILPYYNGNRSDCYDLSPFDETILIDVDYLTLDGSFDAVWGCSDDMLVNKIAVDLNYQRNLRGFDLKLNPMGIPLYWATVVYFKKTNHCRHVFDLVKFIKENYDHYQHVYGFVPSGYFRNDYALSIALHMINGQLETDNVRPLPSDTMLVATENDDMIAFRDGSALFLSEHSDGLNRLHGISINVHVMNKWCIGRMAERIITYATQ